MTDTSALHHTTLGTTGSSVLFLHGLFGQGKNWTQIAKSLAGEHRVTLVDLPNHGRSGWTARVDYAEMAAAVAALIDQQGRPTTVVGHSMGGKVAMALALLRPDVVERLVVVDIAPVRYARLSSFADYVRGLRALDLNTLADRTAADAGLRTDIPDATVRSFLLQNLRRTTDGRSGPPWHWQLNLRLLGDHLVELGGWPELATAPYPGPVLWVAGARSPYITADRAPAMRALFPRVQLVTVKNAGHWVHSEQPEVFIATLRRFLQR